MLAIFPTPVIARARGAHIRRVQAQRAAFNRLRGAGKLLDGARDRATKLAATVRNDGAPFNRKLYNSRICGTDEERIENTFKDYTVGLYALPLLYNFKGLLKTAPKCNI